MVIIKNIMMIMIIIINTMIIMIVIRSPLQTGSMTCSWRIRWFENHVLFLENNFSEIILMKIRYNNLEEDNLYESYHRNTDSDLTTIILNNNLVLYVIMLIVIDGENLW